MTDRELAEKLFREEHPRRFPYSPYERVPQLSDLWPIDQERWIKRGAAARRLMREDH